MANERQGHPVYCDCGCGQTMAKEYTDRFVVKAVHHGREHIVSIPKFADGYSNAQGRERLERLAVGSTN